MKATRKTVADAIECLLTCADRYGVDCLATWSVLPHGSPPETLASEAFAEVYDEGRNPCHGRHIYGAAASLLHEGWLPEGWTS